MFASESLLAGAMLIALTIYALTGGADYGGGVWDLFATGRRANRQREIIAHAIGPIWEANHVWLILVIVILFTAFPPAFARITTVLHIPLTLMLIGVVLRGSAFAFRSFTTGKRRERWGAVFAASSLITPLLLGVTLGSIASGRVLPVTGDFTSSFVTPWWHQFSVATGFFALTLFSYLAGIYLSLESKEQDIQNDFRARALFSGVIVAVLAIVVLLIARHEVPLIAHELMGSRWSIPLFGGASVLYGGSMIAVSARKFGVARIFGAGFVIFVLWGWGFAQFPYVVPPDVTFFNSAAPEITLDLLLIALGAGALLLFPSFFYLFRVFKAK
jgi:cytochrome d ubiquinol oxidase subunit II